MELLSSRNLGGKDEQKSPSPWSRWRNEVQRRVFLNATKLMKGDMGLRQDFAVPGWVWSFLNGAFTLVAKTNKGLHARSSCLLDTDLGGNEKESAVRAVRSPQGHWSPSALQSRTWNTCGAPLHPGASTPVSHCLSTLRSRPQTRASQVEPLLGPHAWKVLVSAFLDILPLLLPRI